MTRAERIAQLHALIDHTLRARQTAVDDLNAEIDATAAARLARIVPLEAERARLGPFLVFQEPATVARVEALHQEITAIETQVRAVLDELSVQREAIFRQADEEILAQEREIARLSAEPESVSVPVPAAAPSTWERFKAWVTR